GDDDSVLETINYMKKTYSCHPLSRFGLSKTASNCFDQLFKRYNIPILGKLQCLKNSSVYNARMELHLGKI
ncbi:hypothetical protein HAX54_029287, partial [Datura stramonium]|nr:hypothetical protein [Datura stramonium]